MQASPNSETIHVWLMLGQYVLVPVSIWAARAIKNSLVSELKQHVDETIRAHEIGEMDKFQDLSTRISRIEDLLMKRGLTKATAARRAAARSRA